MRNVPPERNNKQVKTLEQRFNEKWIPEPNTGCWLRTGCYAHGYGAIGLSNGSMMRAHRLSWTFHKGQIPKGLSVLHHCDTPACVNPDHLFLGTRKDNLMDAIAKRRWQERGEKHYRSKLTNADVAKVRLCSSTAVEIAKDLNISPQAIGSIRRGETWKHLPQQ